MCRQRQKQIDSCKDLSGQLHRYERHQSKMTTINESESLSDIEDKELCRYLNSKDEMRFKKAIWEEINSGETKTTSDVCITIWTFLRHPKLLLDENYPQLVDVFIFLLDPKKDVCNSNASRNIAFLASQFQPSQCVKRAAEVKKVGLVQKSPKVKAGSDKVKGENEKRRSLKINYDALEKLNAELEGLENVNKESTSPSSSHGKLQSNSKLIDENHMSRKKDGDYEFTRCNHYGEEDTYQDDNDDNGSYSGYGDEKYCYDEDYYDGD